MTRHFFQVLVCLTCAASMLAVADPARAEDAVVVLDRGSGSAGTEERDTDLAVRLVEALRAEEVDTRLVVYGARPDGRTRAAQLRGDPAEAIRKAVGREGLRFEAGTDPRIALEIAVRGIEDVDSLTVFLVGAFAPDVGGGSNEEEASDDAGESAGREALARWSSRAPDESRIFALGLSEEHRALLADAKGTLVNGGVVLDVGDVEVEPAPFTPLAPVDGPSPPLEAEIRVPVTAMVSGTGPAGAILEATPSLSQDELDALPMRDGTTRFRIRRDPSHGRVATVSFRAPAAQGVLWLVDPPLPRTFRWTRLKPDARLRARGGRPPLPFEVAEAWVGEPHRVEYRLVRTLSGSSPTWRARGGEGALPTGLDVTFGAEAALDEETAFRTMTVTFAAAPGRPLEARGTLVIQATDHPTSFTLPYHVRVPRGVVAVRLEAQETPQALPPAPDDPWWVLVVDPRNANVPTMVDVEWRVEPPGAAEHLAIEMQGKDGLVIWPATINTFLQVGVRYLVRPMPWPRDALVPPAMLSLEVRDQPSTTGESEGTGRTRPRKPAIVVADDAWAYRVEGDQVVGDPPLKLVLDADGGGGDWRLALLEAPPTVSAPAGAAVDWSVEPVGTGAWHLVPAGAWRGARRGAFSGRTDRESPRVEWPRGDAPGDLEIPVRVPPRWGAAGWVLVVLAGLALALGAWGCWQLRPAPVTGTLLYTVEDRQGAVGRLALDGVGRRTTQVRADPSGRLHLGGDGRPVLRIQPTRVGGLLVEGAGADRKEHLLVDGLTLTVGHHRVRYVSGHEEDLRPHSPAIHPEDLLGPEFDLPRRRQFPPQRFDQMSMEPVEEEEDEAEGPPERS